MKYIVNVEGAIVHDGKYLMIIRGQGESHAGGTLAFVGGKVETRENTDLVLEQELRREIMEEVGIEIAEMAYTQSSHFVVGDVFVVDIIFLCQYASGDPRIADVEEVEEILWLDATEVVKHPSCPPWTKTGIERAEALRLRLGW